MAWLPGASRAALQTCSSQRRTVCTPISTAWCKVNSISGWFACALASLVSGIVCAGATRRRAGHLCHCKTYIELFAAIKQPLQFARAKHLISTANAAKNNQKRLDARHLANNTSRQIITRLWVHGHSLQSYSVTFVSGLAVKVGHVHSSIQRKRHSSLPHQHSSPIHALDGTGRQLEKTQGQSSTRSASEHRRSGHKQEQWESMLGGQTCYCTACRVTLYAVSGCVRCPWTHC